MFVAFKNQGTEDIFNGVKSSHARKTCPETLWKTVGRKLDQLDSVIALTELRIPPGNHLGSLAGNRKGQHSIRINDQYRICFVWTEAGPDDVEIMDYHSVEAHLWFASPLTALPPIPVKCSCMNF